jgi:hypothetical protein
VRGRADQGHTGFVARRLDAKDAKGAFRHSSSVEG